MDEPSETDVVDDEHITLDLPLVLKDAVMSSVSEKRKRHKYQSVRVPPSVIARKAVQRAFRKLRPRKTSAAASDHPQTVQLVREPLDMATIDEGLRNAQIIAARIEDHPNNKVVVTFSGMSCEAANVIRKVIDEYSPTHRIEEVEVYACNSQTLIVPALVFNLAFVPLDIDPDALLYRGEVSDDTSNTTWHIPTLYEDTDLHHKWYHPYSCMTNVDTAVFEIDITAGPDVPRAILSSDLRWTPQNGQEVVRGKHSGIHYGPRNDGTEGVVVQFDRTPSVLVKWIILGWLAPNEHLHVRCMTRKGVGRMHAKWRPVTRVWYHEQPVPHLTKYADILPMRAREAAVKSCARGIFYLEDGHVRVKNDASDICTMCMNCVTRKNGEDVEGYRNCVAMKFDENVIIFHIESTDIVHPAVLLGNAFAAARYTTPGESARIENSVRSYLSKK